MSDEIELKLALSPQGPTQLIGHPLLETLASQTLTLGNQYYDTPAAALQSRRVALRVRRQGDRRLQTLKSAAESRGGLSTRGEWEWSIDDVDCNVAGLDLAGLRALEHPALAELDLDTLRPVFTTDFERRLWRYQVDGCDIEIALDQGTIHTGNTSHTGNTIHASHTGDAGQAGGDSLVIRELELELKQGRPEQLWQLAEKLCAPAQPDMDALSARPANHSKASRAARLSHGWPNPSTVDTASVDALIDAVDSWQDSHDRAWLDSARTRCDRLLQQWKAAGNDSGPKHDERIVAGERIRTDLEQGNVPWRSEDWLTLRRQDPQA
jgi:inorganic triphosphatase YgiF